MNQIREAKLQLSSAEGRSISFGLIVDGKSLSIALSKYLEDTFLDLAVKCTSVICCRATPKQKALVRVIAMLCFFIYIKDCYPAHSPWASADVAVRLGHKCHISRCRQGCVA